ncbi:MAG TPA: BON domain-containing protein [Rubrivivax sp.]|nr:BON domain-containing protein [Rubrivivax sp.]
MTRASNLLTISAAVAAMLALSACNKRDDQSAGQTVDKGVASAKAEMKDAKEATKDAAANAGSAVTDAMITTKINAALVADDQLKAVKINVDTKDGKVVLTGVAPDAGSRDRATTMAKAVNGVVDVDNRLTVQPKG